MTLGIDSRVGLTDWKALVDSLHIGSVVARSFIQNPDQWVSRLFHHMTELIYLEVQSSPPEGEATIKGRVKRRLGPQNLVRLVLLAGVQSALRKIT